MDDRDEKGKFTQHYPDSAFLDAVRSLSVASTQKVADEVGCSYDLAYRRLKRLEEQSEIDREDVGRSFVWIRSESST